MKIMSNCPPKPVMLNNMLPGYVFRFVSMSGSKHRPDDPFVVAEVCASYRPPSVKYNQQPIVNLRTGALAYFDYSNEVIPLPGAVVCLNGEST